jgi:hypothetical protein
MEQKNGAWIVCKAKIPMLKNPHVEGIYQIELENLSQKK